MCPGTFPACPGPRLLPWPPAWRRHPPPRLPEPSQQARSKTQVWSVRRQATPEICSNMKPLNPWLHSFLENLIFENSIAFKKPILVCPRNKVLQNEQTKQEQLVANVFYLNVIIDPKSLEKLQGRARGEL